MNKDYILFNLRECLDGLEKTIEEINSDPDYDYGDYVVDIGHIYHHLNTAWNARNESVEKVEICSEIDFTKWRAMPSDDELLL